MLCHSCSEAIDSTYEFNNKCLGNLNTLKYKKKLNAFTKNNKRSELVVQLSDIGNILIKNKNSVKLKDISENTLTRNTEKIIDNMSSDLGYMQHSEENLVQLQSYTESVDNIRDYIPKINNMGISYLHHSEEDLEQSINSTELIYNADIECLENYEIKRELILKNEYDVIEIEIIDILKEEMDAVTVDSDYANINWLDVISNAQVEEG